MEPQIGPVECGEDSPYARYAALTQETTIDSGTLLSTDYFNSVNEVVMLLGMVPDMPEILDEVYAWQFRTYREHFETSGLQMAPLAIEAYSHSPEPVRQRFEDVTEELRVAIEEAKHELHAAAAAGKTEMVKELALIHSMRLQDLINTGSAVVHGVMNSLDQSAVDDLF